MTAIRAKKMPNDGKAHLGGLAGIDPVHRTKKRQPARSLLTLVLVSEFYCLQEILQLYSISYHFMEILVAWLGNTDIRSSESADSSERGPILSALRSLRFDAAHLLSDHSASQTQAYAKWLKANAGVPIHNHAAKLTSPTDFAEIFTAADSLIRAIKSESTSPSLTFHLSPGTPAMAAVWILLAKTRYPARLIESSKEHGVKEVSIPFDLSADFLPTIDKQADEELTLLMQGRVYTRLCKRSFGL